jgi:hypothetical protein
MMKIHQVCELYREHGHKYGDVFNVYIESDEIVFKLSDTVFHKERDAGPLFVNLHIACLDDSPLPKWFYLDDNHKAELEIFAIRRKLIEYWKKYMISGKVKFMPEEIYIDLGTAVGEQIATRVKTLQPDEVEIDDLFNVMEDLKKEVMEEVYELLCSPHGRKLHLTEYKNSRRAYIKLVAKYEQEHGLSRREREWSKRQSAKGHCYLCDRKSEDLEYELLTYKDGEQYLTCLDCYGWARKYGLLKEERD